MLYIHKTAKFALVRINILEIIETSVHSKLSDHAIFSYFQATMFFNLLKLQFFIGCYFSSKFWEEVQDLWKDAT